MESQLPQSDHYRNLVAIVLGLSVGTIVVGTLEGLSTQIYPELATLDVTDESQVNSVVAAAPPLALVSILVAWSVGILGTCFTAGFLGGQQATLCCVVVAIVYTLMAGTTLSALPLPSWFRFLGLTCLIPNGVLGWWFARRILHKLSRVPADQ